MKFPIYRKYPNGMSYFKITSTERFEEVKFMGNKCEHHVFEGRILPDINFIRDMISMEGGYWVESNADEFESVRKRT